MQPQQRHRRRHHRHQDQQQLNQLTLLGATASQTLPSVRLLAQIAMLKLLSAASKFWICARFSAQIAALQSQPRRP